jgi:hypothetical protein
LVGFSVTADPTFEAADCFNRLAPLVRVVICCANACLSRLRVDGDHER